MALNSRSAIKGEPQYTTGFVAKACCVAPRTAAKWIDSGKLKGWRIPNSGNDRRVSRAELLRFMRDEGIPFPPELQEPRVLWCGDVPDHDLIVDAAYALVASSFQAGWECREQRPVAAVVSVAAMGRAESAELCRHFKNLGVPCVVITTEDDTDDGHWLDAGATTACLWPGAGVAEALSKILRGGAA